MTQSHEQRMRELVESGEKAKDLPPLAYGWFGDMDDSLYLASVYDERQMDKSGDVELLTGIRDLNEVDDGGEFVPYEFDTKIMIAEGGDADQQVQIQAIPFFAAAANARPTIALAAEIVRAAKACRGQGLAAFKRLDELLAQWEEGT